MNDGKTRILVNELLTLFDHVLEEPESRFGNAHWHSLIWNLHNVRPGDWDARPVQGVRTIREIVQHIGEGFLMYEDQAFGDEKREWGNLEINGHAPGDSPEEMINWLRNAHARFRRSVASLSDQQLLEMSPWGKPWTNHRMIEVMIQHPLYHIGELNHIRALLQGNDAWNNDDIGREEQK